MGQKGERDCVGGRDFPDTRAIVTVSTPPGVEIVRSRVWRSCGHGRGDHACGAHPIRGRRQYDSAPTVAEEFRLWGFRRVYNGQRPNDRARGDACAHVTVSGTVNAPNVRIDPRDWRLPSGRDRDPPGRGVIRPAEAAIRPAETSDPPAETAIARPPRSARPRPRTARPRPPSRPRPRTAR
jgi:hypothetical protein